MTGGAIVDMDIRSVGEMRVQGQAQQARFAVLRGAT
jgi:hypothetical protein